MTFGPVSSIASVLGVQLWDGSPVGSGNMWLFGTLHTAPTVGVGDGFSFKLAGRRRLVAEGLRREMISGSRSGSPLDPRHPWYRS
jgi:hypothetical protein